MGMFAGVSEVSVRTKNRYLEPGNYTVEISAIKSGRQNQTEKPYFVAELDIVETDNEDFHVGETVTWMTMVHSYKKYFLEDVKNFVSIVMGADPEEVTEEVCEFVASEDQPLVGKRLAVRTQLMTNQKTGKSFAESAFRLVE
tara:strand:+ start:1115 stop:1540 length:426 start_codon:yes stop_codon:yes gene_type:complete